MSMWFPTVCHITAIILAANKDLAESNRISVRLIIDPIIWQSGEPKVSPGEHDRKQNVSGWQKHASDLVKAILVAVVMETEVGGRVVTVPLVEVMSVWHVGSSEVLHCNNKASYTVWYVILEFHKGFVQKNLEVQHQNVFALVVRYIDGGEKNMHQRGMIFGKEYEMK